MQLTTHALVANECLLVRTLNELVSLCFNQSNASLHFGSSKHSFYFKKPSLPHQGIPYYHPLVLVITTISFFLLHQDFLAEGILGGFTISGLVFTPLHIQLMLQP